MSVSAAGIMLAVGSPFDNDVQGNVKVFEWGKAVRAFKHQGFVVANGYFVNCFGISISLSADGTTLVAGYNFKPSQVPVYRCDEVASNCIASKQTKLMKIHLVPQWFCLWMEAPSPLEFQALMGKDQDM